MIAYKGFHPGLICRGYQFTMGLNFTLSCVKDKPEYVRITMAYHTDDMYFNGKRVEWW